MTLLKLHLTDDGAATYISRVLNTAPANLVAYWALNEQAGAVAADVSRAAPSAFNGAYAGVTLNQPGIGDGNGCPSFNGTTSKVNVYSAALASAFPGDEGSVLLWGRAADVNVWTESWRNLLRMQVNASNRITLQRNGTANNLYMERIAGGNSQAHTITAINITTWFFLAVTWSKIANQVKFYRDGAQVGSTRTNPNAWAGALDSNVCVIGAETATPTSVWRGRIAHVALFNAPLTAGQIGALAAA